MAAGHRAGTQGATAPQRQRNQVPTTPAPVSALDQLVIAESEQAKKFAQDALIEASKNAARAAGKKAEEAHQSQDDQLVRIRQLKIALYGRHPLAQDLRRDGVSTCASLRRE